eukprot:CAMPEP_0182881504 /NCGR_PEP_ID=MMETSP0034_2-20130328/17215_1 /TAXON_ID=156128 /ORGANISM="Nephroselmis pyriformis, Strain CCMP717" /LENGTH=165 /DNA_ID=CAMNT_0025014533 /DNA_START=73 /DNA_END=567 /DNA_ORIENTATION=-
MPLGVLSLFLAVVAMDAGALAGDVIKLDDPNCMRTFSEGEEVPPVTILNIPWTGSEDLQNMLFSRCWAGKSGGGRKVTRSPTNACMTDVRAQPDYAQLGRCAAAANAKPPGKAELRRRKRAAQEAGGNPSGADAAEGGSGRKRRRKKAEGIEQEGGRRSRRKGLA